MSKRPKKEKLKGSLASGMIFVGDPCYLSDGGNSFEDWDKFTSQFPESEGLLRFPNGASPGKGIIINANRVSGKYSVIKKLDENGRLRKIIINVED